MAKESVTRIAIYPTLNTFSESARWLAPLASGSAQPVAPVRRTRPGFSVPDAVRLAGQGRAAVARAGSAEGSWAARQRSERLPGWDPRADWGSGDLWGRERARASSD